MVNSKYNVPPHNDNRINWVDHARGMAIILVVYRHVVSGMKASGVEISSLMFNIQEVFHNFRMPVFFILSGVFLSGSLKRKSRIEVFKTRAATLLYPYLLWALVITSTQIGFNSMSNYNLTWNDLSNIILQPRRVIHMWYLLALFNTSLLYLILSNILIKHKWIHVVLGTFLYAISFKFENFSLLSDVFYFYFFFSIGALVSDVFLSKEKREKILSSKNFKWVLPFFIAGQVFWFLHEEEEHTYHLLFALIDLVACYVVYLFAYKISSNNKTEWLAFIGKNSLYIYILHVPLAAVIRTILLHLNNNLSSWLILIICWLFAIITPIALINFFKNWGIERLFSLQNKRS